MKKFILIRHGMTEGNAERRYIGRTDEPLCPEGLSKLKASGMVLSGVREISRLYVSPYRRCTETASFLFPALEMTVVRDLCECDFGEFEGKNAEELKGNLLYEKWVSENCLTPVPGGEDVAAFRKRCCDAFGKIAFQLPDHETAAIVTHGGCIMAVLEMYGRPKRDFYEYHVENGSGFFCDYDKGCLTVTGGF